MNPSASIRCHGCVLAIVLGLAPATALAAWESNGLQVRPRNVADAGYSVPLSVTCDDRGGAYVACGNSLLQSRLSRVLADGTLPSAWGEDGFYFSGGIWWPYEPAVVADDAGGAYVVSQDVGCNGAHCTGNFSRLRVHHVGSDGATHAGWPDEGYEIGTMGEAGWGSEGRQPVSIASGRGSILVAWAQRPQQDRLAHPRDLRIQRVDFDGSLPWGVEGVQVRDFSWRPYYHAAVPDGHGGAYLFWLDERTPGLYAQHVRADGRLAWSGNGIPIPSTPFHEIGPPVAVSDGVGGAIVAWAGRSGSRSGVFIARVTPGGALPWRGRDQLFQAAGPRVDEIRMVRSAEGGAILAWRTSGDGTPDAILAQRIDHGGKPRWPGAAVTVCDASGTRDHLALAEDEAAGAYLAWVDNRPDFSIFAMRLGPDGTRASGWSLNGEAICARFAKPSREGGTAEVVSLAMATLAANREHGGSRRPANAMLTWSDYRPKPLGSEGWTNPGAFALLLTPEGPAAPAIPDTHGPVLWNQPEQSRSASETPARSLALTPLGAGRVRVSLVDNSRATLEVFDISGRRVWSRELGALEGGIHELEVGDGESLPTGLFLARLTQGARTAPARIVLIH